MPTHHNSLASHSDGAESREWIIGLYDENGSFARFELLPVLAMRLVVASAALTRLRSHLDEMLNTAIWNSNLEGPGTVPPVEQIRLYRVLRSTLLINLETEPTFADAVETIKQVLPSTPPVCLGDHLQAFGFGPEIDRLWKIRDVDTEERISWQPSTARIADELTRLGAQESVDPFDFEFSAFLLAQDASISDVETLFHIASETWRNRHMAIAVAEQSSVAEGRLMAHARRPSVRRSVGPDYETAARTWWEMKDEYEDEGETRGPTQEDLCERLTADGTPIKPRNFRNYIKQWGAAGHNWPPPRSNSSKN